MTAKEIENAVRAMRRAEHADCCLGAALDDICALPVSADEERRAISVLETLVEPLAAEIHRWLKRGHAALAKAGAGA